MNKKDYLDKIVSKIYNWQSKIYVKTEIEEHINTNIEKYKEIGYDDETAEEKAIELMGDDEIVAQQLGAVHNQRKKPALAIILLVLWFAVLAGAYFLLNKFAFGDIGASSLILSAFAISYGLCFAFGALALKKISIPFSICNVLGIVGTCVFNYFALKDLNKTMRGSFSNLLSFVFKQQLVPASTSVSTNAVIIAVCIAGFGVLIFAIWSLIYYAKTKALNNTKTDNKIRKSAIRVCIYLGLVMVCLGIMFGTKTAYDTNKIYDEYVENYQAVLKISQECQTKEDVAKYIADHNLGYKPITNVDGEITKYSYENGLAEITINFDNFGDDNVATPQQYYTENEKSNEFIDRLYGIAKNAGAFEQKEPSIIYSITFEPSSIIFKNGYNSLTLKKIKTDYKDFTSFLPVFKSNQEQFDFYSGLIPKRLYFEKTDEKYYDKNYKFTHLIDFNGVNHYQEEFSVCLVSESNKDFLATRQAVVDVVTANPNATNEQIASLTGTKTVKPTVPQELYDMLPVLKDYDNYVNSQRQSNAQKYASVFADYNSSYEESKLYDSFKSLLTQLEQYCENTVYFQYDNGLQFYISNDTAYCIFFAESFNSFDAHLLKEHKVDNVIKSSIIEEYNYFDKCSFNSYYYDKMGKCHFQKEKVVYYDRNGNEFMYYMQTVTDDDPTTENQRNHYFTDGKSYYPLEKCYIDQDGYFVYDGGNKITPSGVDASLKDAQGNTYFSASKTSWDSQGNMYARRYANRDIELWQEITQ